MDKLKKEKIKIRQLYYFKFPFLDIRVIFMLHENNI